MDNTSISMRRPGKYEALARRLALGIALSVGTIAAGAADRTADAWKAGEHYIVLQSTSDSNRRLEKVKVLEVFSYTCVHCYQFEPLLRTWLQAHSGQVEFQRIPSLWSEKHRAHARLYYTFQVLGRNDLDQAAMDAIHKHRNPLFDRDAAKTLQMQSDFAQAHGIRAQDFSRAYRSEEVERRLEHTKQQLAAFQITSTPALVINESFVSDTDKVHLKSDPDPSVAYRRLIDLASFLIAAKTGAASGPLQSSAR